MGFFMVALAFREACLRVVTAISARSSLRVPNSYMWRWAARAWPAAAAKCPQGRSQCSSPRRMGKPGVESPVERLRAWTHSTEVAMPASMAMTACCTMAMGVAPPRARSVAYTGVIPAMCASRTA